MHQVSRDTLAKNQNYNRNPVATAQIFDSIRVKPLCTYSALRLLSFKSLTDLLNAFKKLLYLSDAMFHKPEKRPRSYCFDIRPITREYQNLV